MVIKVLHSQSNECLRMFYSVLIHFIVSFCCIIVLLANNCASRFEPDITND